MQSSVRQNMLSYLLDIPTRLVNTAVARIPCRHSCCCRSPFFVTVSITRSERRTVGSLSEDVESDAVTYVVRLRTLRPIEEPGR